MGTWKFRVAPQDIHLSSRGVPVITTPINMRGNDLNITVTKYEMPDLSLVCPSNLGILTFNESGSSLVESSWRPSDLGIVRFGDSGSSSVGAVTSLRLIGKPSLDTLSLVGDSGPSSAITISNSTSRQSLGAVHTLSIEGAHTLDLKEPRLALPDFPKLSGHFRTIEPAVVHATTFNIEELKIAPTFTETNHHEVETSDGGRLTATGNVMVYRWGAIELKGTGTFSLSF